MKKTILFSACIFFLGFAGTAQRYGVIDTKYILEKLPDYRDAQKKLDQFSEQWQQEIDQKQSALDKMYKDYDAEQVMLSDVLKKEKEDELYNKEKELRDLQKKRFGFEGDLFKKRQELIKPVQDKVYNAVQKLAVEKQFDFILDKSEGITVIFADPKLDRSEEVIRNLNIKETAPANNNVKDNPGINSNGNNNNTNKETSPVKNNAPVNKNMTPGKRD